MSQINCDTPTTKIQGQHTFSKKKILVGFDGFIDTIVNPINQRKTRTEETYILTIADFADRISVSKGKSTNIECIEKQTLLGGNAPLLTQTLASISENNLDISLIGTLSPPTNYSEIDAAFNPLLDYENINCLSLGTCGKTNAFEFNDGKILFGTMRDVDKISLDDFFKRIPKHQFIQQLHTFSAIATVNWTMMPLVSEFWNWLSIEEDLQLCENLHPYLFVDFADPKKRPIEDLLTSLDSLRGCTHKGFKIILSLNLSEALQLLKAYNIRYQNTAPLFEVIQLIQQKEPLFEIIVGHSQREVCAVSSSRLQRKTCTFPVPYMEKPVATTGAGDAFNAGFLYAITEGFSIENALLWAIATSGIWVRTRLPATKHTANDFITMYKESLIST